MLEQEVVVVEYFAELGCKVFADKEIGHFQGTTRDFVFISRTDAAPGRTDCGRAFGFFSREIECGMRRQDQRAIGAYLEPLENGNTACNQRIRFLDEGIKREYHAVANKAAYVVAQNSGRYQVQYGLFAVDDQRVTGIMATLESRDGGRAVRQQIDNFTFALVTPLRANDNDVLTHYCFRFVSCGR